LCFHIIRSWNILSDFNKNNDNTLPIPAVFVVDKNRVVTYRFLDVNYMNRVDVEKLIEAL
jgi:peroxiredoxin